MDQKGEETHLIEFYGRECPHCISMEPVIEELEKKLGITFKKLEVWHDEANEKEMMKYADKFMEACGGVGTPAFINVKTGAATCGAMPLEDLEKWVSGT